MKKMIVLLACMAVLFALNIFVGSVAIPGGDILNILLGNVETVKPSWRYIILESRLPQAITASLAGGALAVSDAVMACGSRPSKMMYRHEGFTVSTLPKSMLRISPPGIATDPTKIFKTNSTAMQANRTIIFFMALPFYNNAKVPLPCCLGEQSE